MRQIALVTAAMPLAYIQPNFFGCGGRGAQPMLSLGHLTEQPDDHATFVVDRLAGSLDTDQDYPLPIDRDLLRPTGAAGYEPAVDDTRLI